MAGAQDKIQAIRSSSLVIVGSLVPFLAQYVVVAVVVELLWCLLASSRSASLR